MRDGKTTRMFKQIIEVINSQYLNPVNRRTTILLVSQDNHYASGLHKRFMNYLAQNNPELLHFFLKSMQFKIKLEGFDIRFVCSREYLADGLCISEFRMEQFYSQIVGCGQDFIVFEEGE